MMIKKLAVKTIKGNKWKLKDLVDYYAEYDTPQEFVEFLLWNHTCFPFGTVKEYNDSLYKYFLKLNAAPKSGT